MNGTHLHLSRKKEFVITFVVAWGILASFVTAKLTTGNIYAIGQMNFYDNNIFRNNIYMDSAVISPRLILDKTVAFLMKIFDGNWTIAVMIVIYAGITVYSIAVVNLVFNIFKSNYLLSSALLMILVNISKNAIGLNYPCQPDSINTGGAIAFSILAISFAVINQFNKSWLCLAFAAMWHIHEGIYGFAAVFILFFIYVLKQKKISIRENGFFFFYAAVILMIVVPNILTDSTELSNKEFVEIYVYFRLPHHLVPSAWGIKTIARAILMSAGYAFIRGEYLCLHREEGMKGFTFEASLLIAALVISILVQHVFTAIYPLAFVATMYIPKFSKYIVFFSLVWILQAANDHLESKEYLTAAAIICFVVTVNRYTDIQFLTGFTFIIVLSYLESKYRPWDYWERICVRGRLAIPCAVFILFMLFLTKIVQMPLTTKVILMIVVCIHLAERLSYTELRTRKLLCRGICISLVFIFFCSVYGKFYWFENGKLRIQNSDNIMILTMGEDIYQLANQFKEQTDKADEFIADPYDISGATWFQVESQRNCYVTEKVYPSAKSNLKEWYRRLCEITGIFDREAAEIARIMEEKGICYLLVKADNFAKIEESDIFELDVQCKGDSYRVYRLIK